MCKKPIMINKMKYFLFMSISFAIVTLDQATKIYIHTHFSLGENKVVIPGFFNLTYIRNAGGVFGMFSESNELIRTILFLLLPMIAFMLILLIVYQLHIKEKYQLLAYSFIFGGAVGNYIDRIHFKYVVDFLDFYYKDMHWPAFNVGDACIVIGVFIALVLTYKTPVQQQN